MTERSEGSASQNYAFPLLALASLVTALLANREEAWALTRPDLAPSASTANGMAARESRLWHDPLDTSLSTYTRERSPGGQLAQRALLIAVPPTMAPEDVESRLRTRYALHAAMTAEGLVPSDATERRQLLAKIPDVRVSVMADILGCVPEVVWRLLESCRMPPDTSRNGRRVEEPQRGRDAGGGYREPSVVTDSVAVDASSHRTQEGESGKPASQTSLPAAEFPLPIEEFVRPDPKDSAKQQTILAVWLPERTLQRRVGRQWARAAAAALTEYAEKVTFVGPSSTYALDSTDLSGLDVQSPWVTAFDILQIRGVRESSRRWICLDCYLAGTLAGELRQRGIDPIADDVMLVLERDSTFSRSWLTHLQHRGYASGTSPRAWYSRGLDGEYAAGDKRKVDSGGRADKPTANEPTGIERPIGFGTLDYLRRVRHEFRDQSGRIKAVGIFGQDIHDKLLIIRALRPVFPEAVFFTNDLDAYYSHPTQLPHTRNLLVASGHGLQPLLADSGGDGHAYGQGKLVTTSFRDVYQTSAFLAFQHAVCGESHKISPAGKVFEIGTNGPIDLARDQEERASFWPAIRTGFGAGLALLAVLVTGAIVHWRLLGRRFLGVSAQLTAVNRGWYFAILGVCLLCGLVLVTIVLSPEPVSWREGVSVWPTEIMRLLALTLALVFAYHVVRTLGASDLGSLARPAMNTDGAKPMDGSLATALKKLVRYAVGAIVERVLAALKSLKAAKPDSPRGSPKAGLAASVGGGPDVSRIPWRNAAERKDVGAFILAVVLLVIGYGILIILGQPHVPARGRVVIVLDKVITISSVLAMLWLVFLVTEVARRFAGFCAEAERVRPGDADGWSKRREFLVDLADAGGKGIYGPFIVIMILCASRWRGFDDWTWPLGLVIVVTIAISCVLLAHIYLHEVAVGLRDRSIRELSRAKETESDSVQAARMQSILEELRGINRGIFAGPTNHPVMRGLVIPFTGIGGLSLLQWL